MQGRAGPKSLNPSPLAPCCETKISPHPHPITFAGQGKPVWAGQAM